MRKHEFICGMHWQCALQQKRIKQGLRVRNVPTYCRNRMHGMCACLCVCVCVCFGNCVGVLVICILYSDWGFS